MMRFRSLGSALAVVATVALASPALAQYAGGSNVMNKAKEAAERVVDVAKVGQPAPQFTLTDVRTGEEVSLSDYSDKLVIVTWQSINCPWDKMRDSGGYQRVLAPLAKEWESNDVQFLAINSNKTESMEQVASYAEEHNIPYPILKDPGNTIADVYNAQTTPHFYVISKGEQELLYKGGYEQVPTSPEMCGEMDENYLKPVVNAALNGSPVPMTETKSKGCTIKRVN